MSLVARAALPGARATRPSFLAAVRRRRGKAGTSGAPHCSRPMNSAAARDKEQAFGKLRPSVKADTKARPAQAAMSDQNARVAQTLGWGATFAGPGQLTRTEC
jgi:hypothetical protein